MEASMSDRATEGWSRLFDPGERLGWEFRDRLRYWRHFSESAPKGFVADPELRARLDRLTARRKAAVTWAVVAAIGGLLAGAYLLASLAPGSAPNGVGLVLALLVLGGAAWACAWRPVRLLRQEREARSALEALEGRVQTRFEQAGMAWQDRAAVHNAAEWERVNRIPEWGAVRGAAGRGRIDVFGGSLTSWEGFLTTFGASMVADSPPVRVLDLSEGMVAEELCQLTRARGVAVSAEVLPGRLEASGLLAGLDAGQLADVLVESIHGERPDGQREARAVDARILGAICRAVSPALSLARVHEALVAAMGEPGSPRHLTPEEWDRIGTSLFSADYVRQAHERFRSLEAHLHPLRELGSAAEPAATAEAVLHCLSVGRDGEAFATDLFVDLAAQWAIRGVRSRPEGRPGTLIVAGADRLRRRHLERLADACDRERVRLTYLFRHLRDDAELLLGSGATAVFMSLGNHAEAERAARFIGQGHRFVLSQLTLGHGGNRTHASGETEGESTGTSQMPVRWGTTETRSRSWGTTSSYAEGTNWHYAEKRQRVYEYMVEPTALQNLPDYALLVVQHGRGFDLGAEQLAGRPRIQVADCNPDIITLPRVLTQPLPDVELPPAPAAQQRASGELSQG
jgi:hypothetical protein